MKTKTTRLLDNAGRVSIPGYLRELAGLNPGDNVSVEVDSEGVIRISAAHDECCVCGERLSDASMLKAAIGPLQRKVCTHCARSIATKVMK